MDAAAAAWRAALGCTPAASATLRLKICAVTSIEDAVARIGPSATMTAPSRPG
jgi:hypothetical protein